MDPKSVKNEYKTDHAKIRPTYSKTVEICIKIASKNGRGNQRSATCNDCWFLMDVLYEMLTFGVGIMSKNAKTGHQKRFQTQCIQMAAKSVQREQKRKAKSIQKWVPEHVSFNVDFWTSLVKVESKWPHPNDLGGYVREPKEGGQATHAC